MDEATLFSLILENYLFSPLTPVFLDNYWNYINRRIHSRGL